MDVILSELMIPLAYRGVDHAHGFQLQLEIQYADPYNACGAPAISPADCFKVWNTTEKKWEENGEVWNAAGLPTAIQTFTVTPNTYNVIAPVDVTDLIKSLVDNSQPLVTTSYDLVVSFFDELGQPQNIAQQIILTVVQTEVVAFTGFSDNGNNITALITEIENPAEAPCRSFESQILPL